MDVASDDHDVRRLKDRGNAGVTFGSPIVQTAPLYIPRIHLNVMVLRMFGNGRIGINMDAAVMRAFTLMQPRVRVHHGDIHRLTPLNDEVLRAWRYIILVHPSRMGLTSGMAVRKFLCTGINVEINLFVNGTRVLTTSVERMQNKSGTGHWATVLMVQMTTMACAGMPCVDGFL